MSCLTYQSNKARRTNQKPRSWANGFFRIEGFAGKRSLLSPPPPPSLVLFALAPFSARPKCENSSRPDISFVRERLLRRQPTSPLSPSYFIMQAERLGSSVISVVAAFMCSGFRYKTGHFRVLNHG